MKKKKLKSINFATYLKQIEFRWHEFRLFLAEVQANLENLSPNLVLGFKNILWLWIKSTVQQGGGWKKGSWEVL